MEIFPTNGIPPLIYRSKMVDGLDDNIMSSQ